MFVEQSSPQFSWVTEDHLGFWPPSAQNRCCDYPI
jgi:hypothetical protein